MPNSHWLVALPWFEETLKNAKKTQQLNLKSESVFEFFYDLSYSLPARSLRHKIIQACTRERPENGNRYVIISNLKALMSSPKTFSQARF